MFVELNTVKLLLPEIILVVAAAWIYVGGTIVSSRKGWTAFAIAAYAVAAFALWQQAGWTSVAHDGETLGSVFRSGLPDAGTGPLAVDFLAYGVRWVSLGLGLLFSLMGTRIGRDDLFGETLGTLMMVAVGLMLVASARELVFLFVALELISIPTYVLLFLGRSDRANAEATAKYFFLSILSSALLLYGFSFLYGIAGTTDLVAVRDAWLQLYAGEKSSLAALAPISLVLILAGLGFKITAVPFHFYAPDVYQGTTNANAALLAVAPKAAGLIALVRLVVAAMPASSELAWQLVMVLSVLTMTLGNICALWQQNIRRLMAYSSIAHSGYMLIGLSVGLAAGQAVGYGGVAAMLFYLLVYAFASLGTFAALAHLGGRQREVNDVDSLAGLASNQPLVAALIAIFMFSLAGVPPLAGFWGKLTLFTSALGITADQSSGPLATWFMVLAIVGALNAAVAAAYYLRIVGVMYFRSADAVHRAEGGRGPLSAALICALLVVAIGAAPGSALRSVGRAEHSALPALVEPATAAYSEPAEDKRLATKPARGSAAERP